MAMKEKVFPGSPVNLLGMPFACTTAKELLDHLFREKRAGRGGWLLTANLDFLRRYVKDPDVRALYDRADIVVADGMPIVWAAKVQGTPLPERIAGATLIFDLAKRAAEEGRSIYLLGGEEGAGAGAAQELMRLFPGLHVAGWNSPIISMIPTDIETSRVVDELRAKKPDILLVGLGSPKQERLIDAMRAQFPSTWMLGVGVSFSFVCGKVTRAPAWVQRVGLEWLHRLAQEPRRLARRYLLEDLPFAGELFVRVLWGRSRSRARLSGPDR